MRGFYEPKFYEVRALAHAARMLGKPVIANLRLPQVDSPLHERPEIDGYVEMDNREWAIEVKSFPLEEIDVELIANKYSSLGFNQILIIAPQINGSGIRNPKLEFVHFHPALSPITNHYERSVITDRWVQEELANGWYHFRYKVAERSPNKLRWMINQTDKRISRSRKGVSMAYLYLAKGDKEPCSTPSIRLPGQSVQRKY